MIRSLSRPALVAVVLLAATVGSAQAQGLRPRAAARAASVYVPSPPTRGALYGDGQTSRYLLGGQWLFRADQGNGGLAQGWWRGVPGADGWSPVSVPSAYNAGDFSGASMNGYVGWYRRDFTLPSGAFAGFVTAASRRWIIRFESVNYRATVWLNGSPIGVHAGAFLPFELDLKGLRPGVNRLIVRVDNRRSAADLPPGPGGGWWNFGGILREVYLRAVQRVDISALRVRPLLPCPTCAATVTEQATLRNVSPTPQIVTLRGAYGVARVAFGTIRIPRGATRVVTATARIVHPRLWSPDRPFLYRARLTLSDSQAHPLGGWVTDSGIRTISVTHGRLRLNGRLLALRGVNVHEQDRIAGGVLDRAHTSRLISWVRGIGATLIRAHYPLSPEIQELADRAGLLIWSEVPVYQVNTQYLTQPGWVARAHALLRSNILDNQNHPSVLLWSVGNELTTPAIPAEAAYIAGASRLAHQLDPTRPVGMAVKSWPGVACQAAYAPLDVIGFNDYFGWFDAGGGTTDDRDALSPFLDFFHGCYPSKAIFVSEFGFEGNRAGPVEERGTYAFQSNATAFHLGVFATKSWLSGAIYFPLQDFAARPGWGGGNPVPNPPFVEKGMFDLQGNPKPAYSVLSQIYHRTSQIERRSRDVAR